MTSTLTIEEFLLELEARGALRLGGDGPDFRRVIEEVREKHGAEVTLSIEVPLYLHHDHELTPVQRTERALEGVWEFGMALARVRGIAFVRPGVPAPTGERLYEAMREALELAVTIVSEGEMPVALSKVAEAAGWAEADLEELWAGGPA